MIELLPAPARWDQEYDVIVLGSGAGGLVAATVAAIGGARTLVLEKSEMFGGGAAISGGVVWIPNHADMAALGIDDSREKAALYLRKVLGNRARWDLIDAYLDTAPEMMAFMHANTALKLVPRPVGPDYYSEEEGATPGGRMLDPAIYDGRRLGGLFDKLRKPLPTFLLFGGMMVGKYDVDMLLKSYRSAKAFRHAATMVGRYVRDRLTLYRRGTRLALGNALAGRLLESAVTAGVTLWSEADADAVFRAADGRIAGLSIARNGVARHIRAHSGVVLATGGFPGNATMMSAHLPFPDLHHSMAPADNRGDGITIGLAAGGRLDIINRDNAFWTPVSVMQNTDGTLLKCPHLITDRSKPGLIAVNRIGRRFVNEATSYHDFVAAMHREHEQVPTIPAILICDSRFIRKYGLGLVRPGPTRLARFVRSGYLTRANDIAALAKALDIPAGVLEETIAAANEAAKTGIDVEFGKGSTGYNRYLGDTDHKPNPCLGPIARAPFYAVKVYPGDIGTSLGLRTDAHAHVLDERDEAIPGLFACGNDMNSVMAGTYPSGGITLGPAMTFGYAVGREMWASEASVDIAEKS
ncbi:FAD-binding protein (plasmid) [Sphingomonas paeninsulae]|uniref:FAD-binding protein n=1 Tax=Sphingomonas paeninsulae TaxID=2319844 RepID=A0A494T735_SPHPE|nr:FAD-binding protein [Sphingomonas paeninsulae]AYJ85147.1 FAD-binding protein [Sphingomonas paeninsulae]